MPAYSVPYDFAMKREFGGVGCVISHSKVLTVDVMLGVVERESTNCDEANPCDVVEMFLIDVF